MPLGGALRRPGALRARSPRRSRQGVSTVLVATVLALAGAAVVLGLIFTGVLKVPGAAPSHGPFDVVFTESGLPKGTSWSVALHGVPESSSTSKITFAEDDGTYPFSTSAPGYGGTPASGSVTVNGAAVNVPVKFAAV